MRVLNPKLLTVTQYAVHQILCGLDLDENISDQNLGFDTSADGCTQTATMPILCVERFIFDEAGMLFCTGLSSHKDSQKNF